MFSVAIPGNESNCFSSSTSINIVAIKFKNISSSLMEKKWQPTGESQGWRSLWAAIYGVAQSWTRLKGLSRSGGS